MNRQPIKLIRGIQYCAIFLSTLMHSIVMATVSQQPPSCAAVTSTYGGGKISIHGDVEYIASFDAEVWNGHLRAVNIDASGKTGSDQWDAAEKIPSFNIRNILTWNPYAGLGKEFDSLNLSSQQRTDLADDQTGSLLQYLRGDASKERKNGGKYRNRENALGDIVNSAPLFVQDTDFGFRNISGFSGSVSYKKFIEKKKSHAAYIYVGANDGMLHQFNAISGVEGFAYVPASVYRNLKSLSDPNYVHHYFVDGQMSEGDAFFGGAWKNYLLGSTGAGAKSIFALDISRPDSMDAASVKWELSADGDFADLGYVFGKAYVARSRSGDWVAVFGNGYESVNKKAVLYLVNLATGALIKKLEVDGDASKPNGLSAPAFLFNANRELITVYAGDLQGNLWKFDLSDTDKSGWKVAFDGVPLFTAKNTVETQPITTEPLIEFAPQGGYMVMFGTGKQISDADRRSTRIESLYGIWDKPSTSDTPITAARNVALVEQKLTAMASGNRSLSDKPVDWKTKRGWYIDFDISAGEQVQSEPTLMGDVLTVITSTAASRCDVNATSQLLAISYKTGGAYGTSLFSDTSVSSMLVPLTFNSPVLLDKGKVPDHGTAKKSIKPGIFKPVLEKNAIAGPLSDKTGGGLGYDIAIEKRDGTGLQIFHIQPSRSSLFRTWRQLFVGY